MFSKSIQFASLCLCASLLACNGHPSPTDSADNTVDNTVDNTDTASNAAIDTGTSTIDADDDGYASDVDCNDNDPTIHPEAQEVCDGIDNNCDDEVDEGLRITLYMDGDADGFGDADQSIEECGEESGYVTDSSDCDDTNATVFPGSHTTEVPGDKIDQDCDGFDACTDLNCDGWPDILTTQSQEATDISEAELRIHYGSEVGFSADNIASLPTQFASHATTGDLNGDGYLDILFSEDEFYGGGLSPAYAWIYWGSADTYSESNRASLPVQMSWGTAAFDMNGDSYLDLAVSSYDENSQPGLWVYAGHVDGYTQENAHYLSSQSMVSQITPADLNGDGFIDLTIAGWGESGSAIYWGSEDGFDTESQTEFVTGGHAWDVLVDDFNGDTYLDLLFTHQYGSGGLGDFEGPSVVYWGTVTGPDLDHATELDTYAAAGACSGDLNADGYPDAVITELEWYSASKTGDKATIFWGSATGLSDGERTEVPATGPAGCSIYDLNLDGYPDLIIGNQSNGSSVDIDSQIHWGGEDGVDVNNWTPLSTRGVYSVVTHPLENGY